jgi:hypothetical protein
VTRVRAEFGGARAEAESSVEALFQRLGGATR